MRPLRSTAIIFARRVGRTSSASCCGEPARTRRQAHLFDFDGDLYGQRIEVALHAFIRDERRFDSVDALVAEMRNDEAEARRLLD